MTKTQLPPVLRRWRFLAAAVGVASLAGGGMLMAAPSDSATGMAYHNVTTVRLLDTRPATQVGTRSTPLGLLNSMDLEIPGLPDDATSVSVNVTAVDGTEGSFLALYPTGAARPTTSTVNWDAAGAVANNATVNLGPDHSVTIFNLKGTVNVVIDLLGYYAPSPAGGGATGSQGPPGPGVAPAYFSATNNSADTLPPFASLQFGTTGPSRGITSDEAVSVFTVAVAGVYKVDFSVLAVENNYFTVVVNDGSVATDLVFGALGGLPNEGSTLLTLLAGDTFTLQHSSVEDITLAGPVGVGDPRINASIVIERQS